MAGLATNPSGYGTAPHLVAGVWYTLSGRKLSAAGQHYWDIQRRLGATDGRGHYNHERGALIRQAQSAPIRAARVTAGRTIGAQDKAAQEKFMNEHGAGIVSAMNPLNPGPAMEMVASGIKHKSPVETGLGVMAFLPIGKIGRGAKAIRDATAAEKAAAKAAKPLGPLTREKSAEADIVAAIKPGQAKAQAQKELISYEKRKRVEAAGKAYQEAGGGTAGHQAWKQAMAGPYSKLRFDQLKGMDPEVIHHLQRVAYDYPDESNFLGPTVANAIEKLHRGEVLQPAELDKLGKVFGPQAEEEAARLTTGQKIARYAGDVLNVPRALMTPLDISYFLRQSLGAFAWNPKMAIKDFGPAFHSLFSEKNYQMIQKAVESDPNYEMWQRVGLKFTDLTKNPALREEHGQSSLAERIPIFGRIVRGSNRGYTAGLNLNRIHIANAMLEMAAAAGHDVADQRLLKDIAKVTGIFTGRGNLPGKLEQAAPIFNAIFFAPRFMAARFQVFNPANYIGPWALHPFARQQLIKSTLRLAAGGAALLAGLSYLGFKVATDPRNADFGKIRIGNTRFDIFGGHQQWVRLISQLSTKTLISSTTGKRYRLTGGQNLSRLDITQRFFEGKLSPPAAVINDFWKGTDYADKPFSWKKEALSKIKPLIVQDVQDVISQTHGTPLQRAGAGIGAYGLGALGIGVQTYGPKPVKSRRGGAKGYSDPFANLGGDTGGYSDPFANLSAP